MQMFTPRRSGSRPGSMNRNSCIILKLGTSVQLYFFLESRLQYTTRPLPEAILVSFSCCLSLSTSSLFSRRKGYCRLTNDFIGAFAQPERILWLLYDVYPVKLYFSKNHSNVDLDFSNATVLQSCISPKSHNIIDLCFSKIVVPKIYISQTFILLYEMYFSENIVNWGLQFSEGIVQLNSGISLCRLRSFRCIRRQCCCYIFDWRLVFSKK